MKNDSGNMLRTGAAGKNEEGTTKCQDVSESNMSIMFVVDERRFLILVGSGGFGSFAFRLSSLWVNLIKFRRPGKREPAINILVWEY